MCECVYETGWVSVCIRESGCVYMREKVRDYERQRERGRERESGQRPADSDVSRQELDRWISVL